MLPQHQLYVEVFGGSGALLFAKDPSPMEVFNDLDSGVVNFFRVLRDPEHAEELRRRLQLTPYALEEYRACLKHWDTVDDPVEMARMWYVGVMQSMNSSIRTTGWSCTKYPGSNPAIKWSHALDRFPACTQRLAHVQIDHRDACKVLQVYDSLDTLFYLDPPYLPETRRKQHAYFHEMTLEDHQQLLAAVQTLQGMVILSGYPHPLYDEALAGWQCLQITQVCSSAVRAQSHVQRHEQTYQVERVECIWRNPACMERTPQWSQTSLFL